MCRPFCVQLSLRKWPLGRPLRGGRTGEDGLHRFSAFPASFSSPFRGYFGTALFSRSAYSLVVQLVEPLPAVQATRDVERLALRARRRRVSREIPRGRDQRECGVASDELVLPDGRLHALDGMEVPVLAEERSTEHRHQSCRISARDEERGDQRSRLVDLLLTIEEPGKLGEQYLWIGAGLRIRKSRRGHVEEAIDVHAHRGVEDPSEQLGGAR